MHSSYEVDDEVHTSASSRSCVCTVPSPHPPSRRVHSSGPPPPLRLQSHSYLPQLLNTTGPPGTTGQHRQQGSISIHDIKRN